MEGFRGRVKSGKKGEGRDKGGEKGEGRDTVHFPNTFLHKKIVSLRNLILIKSL